MYVTRLCQTVPRIQDVMRSNPSKPRQYRDIRRLRKDSSRRQLESLIDVPNLDEAAPLVVHGFFALQEVNTRRPR